MNFGRWLAGRVDKSRKIAVYDPSEHGGITQYTFGLADALADAGWKVTVITTEDYELKHLKRRFELWFLFKKSWIKPAISAVFSFARTPPSSPEPRAFGSTATSGLRSLRITLILYKAALLLFMSRTRLVHFQWITDRTADLRFMKLLRTMRIKVVYTVHDVLPHDAYTAENQAFFQQVYGLVDKLIVHSENNRRELLDLFAVDPDKLRVIPLGCPTTFVDQLGSPSNVARQQLGIEKSAKVILFFGQIKRYKGLEYLLEAFDTIAARCDTALLLIAGRISESDPVIYEQFRGLLDKYSQNPRIRIHDTYVPFKQIFAYVAAADLVVLPYSKASQSAVLLLAYAAGKPVVVTDTGGLSEVVRDGESGYVVPAKDADAIAEATIKILTDPIVSEKFANRARVLGETVYSWDTVGAITATLYQSLLLLCP